VLYGPDFALQLGQASLLRPESADWLKWQHNRGQEFVMGG
jgi:hypothetical protein